MTDLSVYDAWLDRQRRLDEEGDLAPRVLENPPEGASPAAHLFFVAAAALLAARVAVALSFLITT